jgi:hypothetical protein
MSEQLLPNLLKFPHENWNDAPKIAPIIKRVKLYKISERSVTAINQPEENILDSEFVE